MTAPATLAASHPEAAAWLALYGAARAALDDPAWTAAVPAPNEALPFIDGTGITIDADAVTRLVRTLTRAPHVAGDDAMALLEAAIAEDNETVRAIAARGKIAGELAAVAAALATLPLLQACRTAWAAKIPARWNDAACPICGAWATLVEARGLERRLAHRCGRCGASWAAEPVRCAFCGTRDHARLTALVSSRAQERARVEACLACGGYLKTITMLTATPPDEVALLDLETVHLDVAAIEHEFRRPAPRPRQVSVRAATRSA